MPHQFVSGTVGSYDYPTKGGVDTMSAETTSEAALRFRERIDRDPGRYTAIVNELMSEHDPSDNSHTRVIVSATEEARLDSVPTSLRPDHVVVVAPSHPHSEVFVVCRLDHLRASLNDPLATAGEAMASAPEAWRF